jgi:hypothetical protein
MDMDPPPEDLGRLLAEWLAPYVAAELRKADQPDRVSSASHAAYDAATCTHYVARLGANVLRRAHRFFSALADDGEIGSRALAEQLAISSPRYIAANLTNSLKQRADALGLDRPLDESEDSANRTIWVDRDGIASRMVIAIDAEQRRRSSSLTQPITDPDVAGGRIRIPSRAKGVFPDEAGNIEIDLLGRRLTCRWNPRIDQDKSGVIGVGRATLRDQIASGDLQTGDRLTIEHRDHVFHLSTRAQG